MHELALLRGEVRELRKANEILSRRRRTKRKRLQDGGFLTQAEAENLQSQIDVS